MTKANQLMQKNEKEEKIPIKMAFAKIFLPYKTHVEDLIEKNIPLIGDKTELRDACEYALKNGGKRFRPALVFLVAEALGFAADVSQAALGVEFFHTASLIADDLPCMDNDDERRDKPSLHKVYGETKALLASYALIAAGYECLSKNAREIEKSSHAFANNSAKICLLALENAGKNTGLQGATGGQFLDIFPPDLSVKTLQEVIYKKTASLFEISFVFGWLFGGGDFASLDVVKKAALHFGTAFQIADDFGDAAADAQNGRKINAVNILGWNFAKDKCQYEIAQFRKALKTLKLTSPALDIVADFIIEETEKNQEIK